ncbi:Unknown protein sequence [Pseudomonas amygdali pv. lachrymans]|uniref:Uncharacterized protein n=1 Tax=Pseudomonas amygdali pv. lachrymans TaxID=53707 RepID=A0ABR5KSX7_PSEAV|nr:Unknown protein sequence [Pseudomonas amygdali pv. lachrymans]KPC17916.1 Unknown protein sequence [Pseudomonas amygdali pv. lachrymans]RMT06072.1 hypothetical protein ALP54_102674 [Pseudomonas amygdali pv. lachrymans]
MSWFNAVFECQFKWMDGSEKPVKTGRSGVIIATYFSKGLGKGGLHAL